MKTNQYEQFDQALLAPIGAGRNRLSVHLHRRQRSASHTRLHNPNRKGAKQDI